MTEPNVTASSHPEVAKRHGLTEWDRKRGQWVKPAPEPVDDDAPADGSWLVDDQGDPVIGADGERVYPYREQSNAQLREQLGKRKHPDGTPVEFATNANKATLVELLETNDREQAERENAE